MSNHDEVNDAINDNYVDAPPNSDAFTPGANYPHSKRSGRSRKYNHIDMYNKILSGQHHGQGFNVGQDENRGKDFTPKILQGKGIASPGYMFPNNKYDYSPDLFANNMMHSGTQF